MTTHLHRRSLLSAGGLWFAAAGLCAPALARGAPALVTIEGRAFASRWSLALPAGADGETLRAPLQAMLDEVDREMSPWRADSEITFFNLARAGACAVSDETALVAQAALETAARSSGAFDPTVGPLVARFGFGPIARPEDGVSHWERLAAEPGLLTKAEDDITLDLCGIAKGRALDRMAEIVAGAGHEDFLIDMSGELVARGRHPAGRPWQVAIEDPRPGLAGTAGGLRLEGMAVATSGSREQSYRPGRRVYSHIIDPGSGRPVESNTASVSVMAEDGMTADAWATALFAAGSGGPDLARRAGIAALFLIDDGARLAPVATGGFDRVLL